MVAVFLSVWKKNRCNSSQQSFSSLETRNQKILFWYHNFLKTDFTYLKTQSKVQCSLYVYYWYNPGPMLLLLRWDLMIVSMSVKSKLSAWCDKMNRNCAVKRERERHVLGRFFKAFCVNFEFMGKTPSFLAHYSLNV